MRWAGALLTVSLIGLGACSDPITDAINVTGVFGGREAGVSGSLPKTRAAMLTKLTEYGYEPDDPARCVDVESLECASIWAPEIERADRASERLHFFKRVNKKYSGTTYGLLVDIAADGAVLNATGYKSFEWVF